MAEASKGRDFQFQTGDLGGAEVYRNHPLGATAKQGQGIIAAGGDGEAGVVGLHRQGF
jgi:hypothetical protein